MLEGGKNIVQLSGNINTHDDGLKEACKNQYQPGHAIPALWLLQ